MRCHKATPQAIRCYPFLGCPQTSLCDFLTTKQVKMTKQDVPGTIEDDLQSGIRSIQGCLVVVEIQDVQVVVQIIRESRVDFK